MNRQFVAFTGIAMMLIVLNHAITLGLNDPNVLGFPHTSGWNRFLSFLQTLGLYGVPIFYFISGSFIAYAVRGDPPRLSNKFLISSLRHILLPYLIWSLIFYVLIYFQFNERYTLLEYAKNLLVGYPYHFIPLLVFYYLTSPILVLIGKRYPGLMILVIGLYQLFSINVLFPGTFGFILPGWMRWLTPPVLRTTIAEWAIYFPLGLVYGLHSKQILPWLKRFAWACLLATMIVLIVGALNIYGVISLPMVRYLLALPFIFLLPVITRDRIPFASTFEKIGKRSYGLYLTHLIVLNLVLLLSQVISAWIFNFPWMLLPLLFALGLLIPISIMGLIAEGPTRSVYRYLFG